MSKLKSVSICLVGFGFGLAAAQLGAGAQAHGTTLTRLDVQQSLREVMRTQQTKTLSRSDMEAAVRQVLVRCRFKGQMLNEETEGDDAVDFQGQFSC